MNVFDTDYATARWDQILKSSVAVAYLIDELAMATKRMTFNLTAPASEVDVGYTGPVFLLFDQLSELAGDVFSDSANGILNLQQQMLKLRDGMWFILELLGSNDLNQTTDQINATLDRNAAYWATSAAIVSNAVANLSRVAEALEHVSYSLTATNADAVAAAAERKHLIEQKELQLSQLEKKQALIREFQKNGHQELEFLTKKYKWEMGWLRHQTTGLSGFFHSWTIIFLRQTVTLEFPEFLQDTLSLEQLEADEKLIASAGNLQLQLNHTLQLAAANNEVLSTLEKCTSTFDKIAQLVSEMASQGNASRYSNLFNMPALNESLTQVCSQEAKAEARKQLLEVALKQLGGAIENAAKDFDGQTTVHETVSGFPAKVLSRAMELVIKLIKRIKKRIEKRGADTLADIVAASRDLAKLTDEATSADVLMQSLASVSRLLANLRTEWQYFFGEFTIFQTTAASIGGGVTAGTSSLVFELQRNKTGQANNHALMFMETFMFYIVHASATAAVADIYSSVFRQDVLPPLGELREEARAQSPNETATVLKRMNDARVNATQEVERLSSEKRKELEAGIRADLETWSTVLASFLNGSKSARSKREVKELALTVNRTDVLLQLKSSYVGEGLMAEIPISLVTISELLAGSLQWKTGMADPGSSGNKFHLAVAVRKLWKTMSTGLSTIDVEMRKIASSFLLMPNLVSQLADEFRLTNDTFAIQQVKLLTSQIRGIIEVGISSTSSAYSALENVRIMSHNATNALVHLQTLSDKATKEVEAENAAAIDQLKATREFLQFANDTLAKAANASKAAQEQFNAAIRSAQDAAPMAGVSGLIKLLTTPYRETKKLVVRAAAAIRVLLDPGYAMTFLRDHLGIKIGESSSGTAKHNISAPMLSDTVALAVTAAFVEGADRTLQNGEQNDSAAAQAALLGIQLLTDITVPQLRQSNKSAILTGLLAHAVSVQEMVVAALQAMPRLCNVSETAERNACIPDGRNAAIDHGNAALAAAVQLFNETVLRQLNEYFVQEDIVVHCHPAVHQNFMEITSILAQDIVSHNFTIEIPISENLGPMLADAANASEVAALIAKERDSRVEKIRALTEEYIKCQEADFNNTVVAFVIPAGKVLINTTEQTFAAIEEAAASQLLEEQQKLAAWSDDAMTETLAAVKKASDFLEQEARRAGISAAELRKLVLEEKKDDQTDAIGEYQQLVLRTSEVMTGLHEEEKAFRSFLRKLDDHSAAILSLNSVSWAKTTEIEKQGIISSTLKTISGLRTAWLELERFFGTVSFAANHILSELEDGADAILRNPEALEDSRRTTLERLETLATMAAAIRQFSANWVSLYAKHIRTLVAAVQGLSVTTDTELSQKALAEITKLASNATAALKDSAQNSFTKAKGAVDAKIEFLGKRQKPT